MVLKISTARPSQVLFSAFQQEIGAQLVITPTVTGVSFGGDKINGQGSKFCDDTNILNWNVAYKNRRVYLPGVQRPVQFLGGGVLRKSIGKAVVGGKLRNIKGLP